MRLYDWLADENSGGIACADAEQLITSIFCTFDELPNELKGEMLGRAEFIDIFSRLVTSGTIPKSSENGVENNSPLYWNLVLDDFLSDHRQFDETFRGKIPSFF